MARIKFDGTVGKISGDEPVDPIIEPERGKPIIFIIGINNPQTFIYNVTNIREGDIVTINNFNKDGINVEGGSTKGPGPIEIKVTGGDSSSTSSVGDIIIKPEINIPEINIPDIKIPVINPIVNIHVPENIHGNGGEIEISVKPEIKVEGGDVIINVTPKTEEDNNKFKFKGGNNTITINNNGPVNNITIGTKEGAEGDINLNVEVKINNINIINIDKKIRIIPPVPPRKPGKFKYTVDPITKGLKWVRTDNQKRKYIDIETKHGTNEKGAFSVTSKGAYSSKKYGFTRYYEYSFYVLYNEKGKQGFQRLEKDKYKEWNFKFSGNIENYQKGNDVDFTHIETEKVDSKVKVFGKVKLKSGRKRIAEFTFDVPQDPNIENIYVMMTVGLAKLEDKEKNPVKIPTIAENNTAYYRFNIKGSKKSSLGPMKLVNVQIKDEAELINILKEDYEKLVNERMLLEKFYSLLKEEYDKIDVKTVGTFRINNEIRDVDKELKERMKVLKRGFEDVNASKIEKIIHEHVQKIIDRANDINSSKKEGISQDVLNKLTEYENNFINELGRFNVWFNEIEGKLKGDKFLNEKSIIHDLHKIIKEMETKKATLAEKVNDVKSTYEKEINKIGISINDLKKVIEVIKKLESLMHMLYTQLENLIKGEKEWRKIV